MSDPQTPGFGKFVPGFDFLQNLARGATQAIPQLPDLSNWIAPTLNVEELDKRIGELKAVHFWLDQNSKALTATIQALEVQKMTLATLKGMNLSMAELAESMKLHPVGSMMDGMQKAAGAAAAAAGAAKAGPGKDGAAPAAANTAKPAAGVVDPLQWWSALTQQFQQIATDALKDVARSTGMEAAAAAQPSGGKAKQAGGPAQAPAAARKAAAKKPARKNAPRKGERRA
jgi:hypothetical protein